MKKILKKYLIIIILIVFELFSYFKTQPKNKELFFMVWTFIFIALLINNIFNTHVSRTILPLSTKGREQMSKKENASVEELMGDKKIKIKSKIFKNTNILYFCLFIINVVIYIQVI